MNLLRAVLVLLALAFTAIGQLHAPPVPASQARKAGMTNAGVTLLPPAVIGGQYSAAIDPTTGFGYFGPSHSAIVSKIDLNGPLPKVVQDDLPNSMPKEVKGLYAVMLDSSDPDPLKHYVYATGGRQILKMAPGDATHAPQVVATLRPTSASAGSVGVIDTSDPDPARHYAYFVESAPSQPSHVLRVRLSDFSDQGAETLQMGFARYAAIDTVRHYAYFTGSAKPNGPPQICKVNLATFRDGGQSVATLTMDSTKPGDGIGRDGFNNPGIDVGLVVDEAHGYAYFGTSNYVSTDGDPQIDRWPQNQSLVVRVKLGEGDSFPAHPLQELDLRPGERQLTPAVIDVAHGNVYFGTDNTYPAHVYMIHVGDGTKPMREVGRLDLNLGSIPLTDLPHDGRTSHATAAQHGEVFLRSAILDAAHNAIYFGNDSTPGQIIKVGINGKK